MGHGIGMDVHERPFLSPEDETPLEAGMTFTDEPSILVPGSFGMRIENVVVCDDERRPGAERLPERARLQRLTYTMVTANGVSIASCRPGTQRLTRKTPPPTATTVVSAAPELASGTWAALPGKRTS